MFRLRNLASQHRLISIDSEANRHDTALRRLTIQSLVRIVLVMAALQGGLGMS